MIIQHNIAALNAHRNLGINNSQTSGNLEKLSSGYRINRAADDAAGLAISEKMRGQIRGLAMAETNVSNGIQLIQTAEGGLNETHAILHRMRELAVQASNGTYVQEDRDQIELEFQALKSEIDRIASSTHYNGINLLDGSVGGVAYSATAAAAAVGGNIFGTGGAVSLATVTGSTLDLTTFDGQDATIIVRADNTLTVQFGDQSFYSGAASGATPPVYTFTDQYGKAAFTLTVATGGAVASKEGVYTGVSFASAAAATGTLTATADDTRVAGTDAELIFQIGANGTADQQVGLHVENMASGNIGDKAAGNFLLATTVVTRELANAAIAVIDAATNQVSSQRAQLGALQNRMEHTMNNLGVTKENLTAAESTIRDVDMAKEMMEFTKNSILVQAAQSMLAQANSLPQGVLSLLS